VDNFGKNTAENKICGIGQAFEFKKVKTGYEINDYRGISREIVLPKMHNEIPVIHIGKGIFYYKGIKSVVIPDSVTYIGDRAFHGNNLSSITIPDSVIDIGDRAFSDNQLTKLIIPEMVKSIGNYAFENNQLKSVVIPDSVTYIGDFVFCKNQLNALIIPDAVKTIGKGAFSNNQLKSVVIPDSVISIRSNAFENNHLKGLIIPDSVTHIGDKCFFKNNLTDIILGNSIMSIGKEAFKNNQLKSVVIPDSVTYIGDRAFENNHDLKLYCKPNSHAEKHFVANNIPFSYSTPDNVSDSVKIKLVETFEDNPELEKEEISTEKNARDKGIEFETFFLDLFPERDYILLKRTNKIDPINGAFVKNNLKIDMQFRDCKTRQIFAVKCRYRRGLFMGRFDWDSKYLLSSYREFERDNNVPIFISMGLGGIPEKPERVFFMPLKEIPYSKLYPNILENYEIKNAEDVFKILNEYLK